MYDINDGDDDARPQFNKVLKRKESKCKQVQWDISIYLFLTVAGKSLRKRHVVMVA